MTYFHNKYELGYFDDNDSWTPLIVNGNTVKVKGGSQQSYNYKWEKTTDDHGVFRDSSKPNRPFNFSSETPQHPKQFDFNKNPDYSNENTFFFRKQDKKFHEGAQMNKTYKRAGKNVTIDASQTLKELDIPDTAFQGSLFDAGGI